MLTRNRNILLSLAFAVVVGLAVFAPQADQPGGSSSSSNAGLSATSAGLSTPARTMDKPDRRVAILSEFPARATLGDTKAELFSPQSWQPPPKVVAPAPPPPPQPPPMSYRFAGRLLQDGKLQVFVSKGDTPVAIKQGDALDGGYVVEAITADTIALIYPPMGYKASISIPPSISTAGAPPPANTAMTAPPFALGSLPAQAALNLSAATSPPQNIIAPVTAAPRPSSGPARVQWDGPTQVKLGAHFSVALRVKTDQPISGSPMQVRFDPAILESISVQPGKLYATEAGRGFNYRTNPEDGTILVGASSPSASASGGAELVVLTFKPLRPSASAEVRLTALNLHGPTGHPIARDGPANFRISVTP